MVFNYLSNNVQIDVKLKFSDLFLEPFLNNGMMFASLFKRNKMTS